ncbi:MAG: NIPSNAP family protein [Chitinophagaceae bacterium]
MNRRKFVKASLITGTLAPMTSLSFASPADASKTARQFYELRTYNVRNGDQEKVVTDYMQQAAIPAYNRMGIKSVGFFKEMNGTGQARLYLLIPVDSIEQLVSLPSKLAADKIYLKAGENYLNKPAADPAYTRMESSLLQAFTGMPKLIAPEKKSRIFELRRYESHSETAGALKINMFNNMGEIDIFKRVGLTPVFFGEAIIGELRPNLTYMLTFDDMAEHDKNWKVFIADADWKRISSIPEYKDANIVSKITRTFLEPLPFSQV